MPFFYFVNLIFMSSIIYHKKLRGFQLNASQMALSANQMSSASQPQSDFKVLGRWLFLRDPINSIRAAQKSY